MMTEEQKYEHTHDRIMMELDMTHDNVKNMIEQSGLDIADIINRLTLTVSADTDFFGSIAKLRALRLLWGNICAALKQDKIVTPFIHAEGSERYFSLADPWVNMLRATMSTLAAGIGGADVVTALPCTSIAESDNLLTRRVARNTQVILQEESKLAVEPAAAATLSAYIGPLKHKLKNKNVGLLMCGANIDHKSYSDLLRKGQNYINKNKSKF